MPRWSAARTNDTFDDGRVRRTLRSLAAPEALRAWNTTTGLVARPRTFTTSEGLALLGACVVGAAGGAGVGAAAGGAAAVGSGAGTHVPTMLSGALPVTVWPVNEVNVESTVGLSHMGLPTVNRPVGPPLMVSSNDDTGAFGRLSSVLTRRMPFSEVVAESGETTGPVAPSPMNSPGRPPVGFSAMNTPPVSGVGNHGETAFAVPTCEAVGQANTLAWSGVQSVLSAFTLANSPAGSVTTAFLIRSWLSGCVTTVVNCGWPPTWAGWSAVPSVAVSCGVNGRAAAAAGMTSDAAATRTAEAMR